MASRPQAVPCGLLDLTGLPWQSLTGTKVRSRFEVDIKGMNAPPEWVRALFHKPAPPIANAMPPRSPMGNGHPWVTHGNTKMHLFTWHHFSKSISGSALDRSSCSGVSEESRLSGHNRAPGDVKH
ncbi:hypothetical protein FIBSPDRAFT_893550 [Athelia psychrophila]|uniref:Uncharacterized protein n=1 Tax=Athelia psychrophila TaxID=1759441 RepID=A0A166H1C0_9AGAM|nr:hypothetical protein FIBSPDRAFT_897726 [Fibularhizoctonia sp. CBS 109695]KZP18381.1 hypothetical protein FIBSPDRAFT_893550 [Fibularhizoctonia sp. CBS 109695]